MASFSTRIRISEKKMRESVETVLHYQEKFVQISHEAVLSQSQ